MQSDKQKDKSSKPDLLKLAPSGSNLIEQMRKIEQTTLKHGNKNDYKQIIEAMWQAIKK